LGVAEGIKVVEVVAVKGPADVELGEDIIVELVEVELELDGSVMLKYRDCQWLNAIRCEVYRKMKDVAICKILGRTANPEKGSGIRVR
jgi:hypothetical protein